MDNSIQRQLEERRRRLEANRRNGGEPMDVDSELADQRHDLEQHIVSLSSREHELETELHEAHNALAANRARLGLLRQVEARNRDNASQSSPDGHAPSSEAPAASAPSAELTQEEKDHEIAVLLQRQMEREMEQEDRAQQEAAQPQQPSGGFSFSFSRTGPDGTMTFSSSDPNSRDQMDQLMARLGARNPMLPLPMGGMGGGLFDDDPFMGGFGSRNHFFGPAGPIHPGDGFNAGPIGISPFMFGRPGPFGMGMNIDLDNMDHEQILRLQEMIGHVPRGASAQQISELPTSQYHNTEVENAKDENDERRKCSICLEQFEEGEEIRTLPCFHIFHADEIDKWLQQNSVCPICRVPIQSRDDADVPTS